MKRNSFGIIAGKEIHTGLAIIALLWILSGCGNSNQKSADTVAQADAVKMDREEIIYDDGIPESQHSPWWDKPGGQLAVVFTPTFYPAVLTKVRFLVGISGIPTTEFRVRVFGGTVSDGPDESLDLLKSEVTASAEFGNKWVEIDLSGQNIIITSGDFCVSMEWLTPPGDYGRNAQSIGVDYSKPDGRSWWKTDFVSRWERIEEVANIGDRDVMIRATIKKK
ncbi:MAG: hypothetical protein E3J22_06975 [Candidatus Aminicenantes bacterium]|nr:MAG: hypothetical protein E3J22_06975 [Candidatus Aminicenantes bacterium]